jgi:tetratricopeptide (TPR) repeat protein
VPSDSITNLAEAHNALRMTRLVEDWDWKGAEQELSRVLALNPGPAKSYLQYGMLLVVLGRLNEALRMLERSRQIDPVSPVLGARISYISLCGGQIRGGHRRGQDDIGDRSSLCRSARNALRCLHMLGIELDPRFKPLRLDARLSAILQRMNLAQ